MREHKLTVRIEVPATKIFDFVVNPKNTPKWIDFIEREETNEWPPKLGTIYKNQGNLGVWQELEMTEFEKDKMFVMTNRKNGYHVRYALVPAENNSTELEYYEWMYKGELDEPFEITHLEKLKSILEKPA